MARLVPAKCSVAVGQVRSMRKPAGAAPAELRKFLAVATRMVAPVRMSSGADRSAAKYATTNSGATASSVTAVPRPGLARGVNPATTVPRARAMRRARSWRVKECRC